mmetsp:Transcript_101730/g.286853  ORF Transcript_101730/g.286853 Transcript_101730/m.286853 type:complete len:215 (+) Transcript_101730:74-718(+)
MAQPDIFQKHKSLAAHKERKLVSRNSFLQKDQRSRSSLSNSSLKYSITDTVDSDACAANATPTLSRNSPVASQNPVRIQVTHSVNEKIAMFDPPARVLPDAAQLKPAAQAEEIQAIEQRSIPSRQVSPEEDSTPTQALTPSSRLSSALRSKHSSKPKRLVSFADGVKNDAEPVKRLRCGEGFLRFMPCMAGLQHLRRRWAARAGGQSARRVPPA